MVGCRGNNEMNSTCMKATVASCVVQSPIFLRDWVGHGHEVPCQFRRFQNTDPKWEPLEKQAMLTTPTRRIQQRFYFTRLYRDADKSLARQGRKWANVSVRIEWISFGALPCREKKKKKKKLDYSPRLDFFEIARVPAILPSLFPSLSG